MTQLITGAILVLSVGIGLFFVIMGKRLYDRPEGTRFGVVCPHCEKSHEVELSLVNVSEEEVSE